MFYCAWVCHHEPFNAKDHLRQDLDILHLQIIHREGEYAFANIAVRMHDKKPLGFPDKPYLLMTLQDGNPKTLKPLFRGRIEAMPHFVRHQEAHFRLVAKPHDADKRLENLAETLRTPPFWDPLLTDPLQGQAYDELLEARGALFYWDRWTHDVRLSPVNQGKNSHHIGSLFFKDSLHIDLKPPPYENVHITLSAEWTQSCSGGLNLGPSIAHHFAEGYINTLTPQDFQQRWNRAVQKLHRTGYRVDLTHLEEFTPPFTGILNLYPALSNPVWQIKNAPSLYPKREQIRLKRTWFQATLLVSWAYRQRRRETVHMTLHHHVQKSLGTRGSKKLHLKLQSPVGETALSSWSIGTEYKKGDRIQMGSHVYQAQKTHTSGFSFVQDEKQWLKIDRTQFVDRSSSSFFATPRGTQVIQHALERARSYLQYSARCVSVTIEVPFEQGWFMTPDDLVTLEDDRLPSKTITGKVISYMLVVDGDTGVRTVKLTLGCSIGGVGSTPHPPLSDKKNLFYAVAAYGGGLGEHRIETPSGLACRISLDLAPGLSPSFGAPHDVIEQVVVQNPASEQNALLAHEPSHTYRRAIDVLKDHPTTLQVYLKDLRTQGILEHTVAVDVLTSSASPPHLHVDH